MRTSTWLRAVIPPALVLSLCAGRAAYVPAEAQTRAGEQTLYVSAVDRNGQPVPNLGPEAFVVSENGVRREILSVSRATEPVDVTLLIDNSTAARDAIVYLRKAVPAFIAALTPANSVSLVTIADRPTILTRFTTDTKKLTSDADRIFSLPSSGATLLDAIFEVSQGLRSRDAARAAIVSIATDGTEFTNRHADDIVAELKRAGASLHMVAIGRFEFIESDLVIRERSFLMDRGPRETGGALYTMLAPSGIPQNLDKVARDLTSQYKVVYGRPQTTIPPDRIQVTSAREGITVRGIPARTPKGAR